MRVHLVRLATTIVESTISRTHPSGFLQKCRAYSSLFPRKNLRNSAICEPFYSSIHRNSYSSSSCSSYSDQEMGFLSWYLKMLDVRPIITKSISAGLIYGAADLTAQTMTMGASESLDLIRTLRMAMFGLLLLGPAQHVWFNFLGRILPKRDMATTFKKLFVGQLFYGPSCTAVFFTYNAVLQGESGSEIALRLKRDLVPTLTGGLMYWPVCDFFTYKIIPVHLQPLMNSSFSFLWTIYLTYMASLEKATEA